MEVDDRRQPVIITVERLGGHDVDGDPSYLVVFSDVGPPSAAVHGAEPRDPKSGDGASTILEGRTWETRQRLQTMIEEHESTVDELKSANEELQSLNEEYQSTNEEMETSKEELQSLNEELNTVNAELNAKIEQTDTANADLRNILNSTGIATIFLDRNLVIRNFTPAATGLFDLLPRDHGRPLTDIVARVDDVAHLTNEVRIVLEIGKTVRRRIQRSDSSAHYLMHILPYVTETRKVDGALITFVDVSELVEFESQLRTMVEELNHRVRNMLAVVGSIATQTLAAAPEPAKFATAFMGRINSMAKGYSLISEQKWGSVTLDKIVMTELEPYGRDGSSRISVAGPPVAFNPQQALAMGLVFHGCRPRRRIWCLVEQCREPFRILAVERWSPRGRLGRDRGTKAHEEAQTRFRNEAYRYPAEGGLVGRSAVRLCAGRIARALPDSHGLIAGRGGTVAVIPWSP